MLSGLSLLQLIGLALLAGLGLIVSNAIKLILENEYTSWASGLARLFAWLAGRIYRPRRAEWWADLRYAQMVEKQTGICKSASWLVSAPRFALRDGVAAVRDWRRRLTEHELELALLRDQRLLEQVRAGLHAEVRFSGTLKVDVIRADPQDPPARS